MTAAAIDSVFEKTTGIKFEVILVDNASTDGSREFFEKDSRIKYFYLSENLGFGQANNYGVEHGATGTYLFFLNTDTLLLNDAISRLFEYLEDNPSIGVVGSNLFSEFGQPVMSYERIFPGIFHTINSLLLSIPFQILFGKNANNNLKNKPIAVAYVSGAALMVSKTLFTQMGGFSSDFFMYYEETDLCKRICNSGYKIFNLPSSRIIHLEGGTIKRKSSNFNKEYITAKSREKFICRNHGKMYVFFDKLLCCLYYKLRPIRRLFTNDC